MAEDDAPDIPTGRIRRTAAVASTVGGQGARVAGATALDALRRSDGSVARLERSHLEAAQKMVEVLGTMKGAAMKIGQLASFVELDFLPPEFRPLYQESLAQLRADAPALPFKRIEKVLRQEWGEPISAHFADLEPTAAAAASVGQVHRGRLHDGREVAVKVQYPGIDEALRADLQNVGVITALAKGIAPGLDARAVAAEIRERVLEEMDYELEAQNQRRFARAYRAHPFAFVPDVVTSLSRARVLVSEWVGGDDFETVRAADEATRNRFGEAVYRFGFGSMYHVGWFNADPHPGNYRLLADGRIAFLDFGSVKQSDPARLARNVDVIDAAVDHDAERFHRVLGELGYLARPDKVVAERVLAQTWALGAWYLTDAEVRMDAAAVAQTIAAQADPREGYWDVIRRGTMPADSVMYHRLELGIVAVLGQLRAKRNWHRIAREWWHGDPPATELGAAEDSFWSERNRSRIDAVRSLRRAG